MEGRSTRSQLALRDNLSPDLDHGGNGPMPMPVATRTRRPPASTVGNLFKYNSASLELDLSESEQCNRIVTIKQVNYNINREKAMIKKLQASNRDSDYTLQVGEGPQKNYILHFQAGLYEFVRKAAHYHFLSAASFCYETEITALQEKSSNHIVQTTYKIRKKGRGPAAYTINFYHTKSAVLVNGRMANDFLDKDWPNICQVINEYQELNDGLDHNRLNDSIRNSLQRLSLDIASGKWVTATTKNDPKRKEANGPAINQYLINETEQPALESATCQTLSERQPTINQSDLRVTPQRSTLINPIRHTPRPDSTPQAHPPKHSWGPLAPVETQTFCPSPQREQACSEPPTRDLNAADFGQASTSLNNKQGNDCGLRKYDLNRTQTSQMIDGMSNSATAPHGTSHDYDDFPHGHRVREESRCSNCLRIQHEWREANMSLQAREKKLGAAERTLKHREKELEKTLHQLQTQKALIAGLENRVKELTSTNSLLQQIIDASGTPNQDRQSRAPMSSNMPQGHHTGGTPGQITIMQEEIRSLRDELKWKDMENRFSQQMYNMENRILTQLQFRPCAPAEVNTPFVLPLHPGHPFYYGQHHTESRQHQLHPQWTQRLPGSQPAVPTRHTHHNNRHPHLNQRHPQRYDAPPSRCNPGPPPNRDQVPDTNRPGTNLPTTPKNQQPQELHPPTEERSLLTNLNQTTTVNSAGNSAAYKDNEERIEHPGKWRNALLDLNDGHPMEDEKIQQSVHSVKDGITGRKTPSGHRDE